MHGQQNIKKKNIKTQCLVSNARRIHVNEFANQLNLCDNVF
jgi:hypothetical protein